MAVAKAVQIEVPPLKIGRIKLHIVGNTRLVCNAFPEKAIREMLDKQMGKAKQGREAKVPSACFAGSLYPLPGEVPILHDEDEDNVWMEGRFGFPSIAFKAAAVRAATDVGLKMTDMRRSFHIDGELVEIISDPPKMRRDMVKVGMGTSDVRFRAEFENWQAFPIIKYNKGIMNVERLINLFRTAGFGVGVGEWRPERDGMWGTFGIGPNHEDLGGESL